MQNTPAVLQQYLAGLKGSIAEGWSFDVFGSYDQSIHNQTMHYAVLKSQVQRLLASRKDIFTDYNQETFEAVFSETYTIHESVAIRGSERRLYLMEKRAE